VRPADREPDDRCQLFEDADASGEKTETRSETQMRVYVLVAVGLAIASCSVGPTTDQRHAEDAHRAHHNANYWIDRLDGCAGTHTETAIASVRTLEAIVMKNLDIGLSSSSAISPLSKRYALENFHDLYPMMFDTKVRLADSLAARDCKSEAAAIYQEDVNNYPGAVYSGYRDRAVLALAAQQP